MYLDVFEFRDFSVTSLLLTGCWLVAHWFDQLWITAFGLAMMTPRKRTNCTVGKERKKQRIVNRKEEAVEYRDWLFALPSEGCRNPVHLAQLRAATYQSLVSWRVEGWKMAIKQNGESWHGTLPRNYYAIRG